LHNPTQVDIITSEKVARMVVKRPETRANEKIRELFEKKEGSRAQSRLLAAAL